MLRAIWPAVVSALPKRGCLRQAAAPFGDSILNEAAATNDLLIVTKLVIPTEGMKTILTLAALAITGCSATQKPAMKTLEQHQREAIAAMPQQITERPNGIACPKCGAELWDDCTRVLTSNPPQTPIFCKKCGYAGSRF